MAPHSAGLAPATRVASRKLGPVAGGRSPPSASMAWATRTFATTWGRWLTAAITRSWTSASMTAGRAPRPVSRRCRRSSRVPCVVAVGVRYQVAPSKRSSRACSTPAASEPASGWPPTKRGSRAASTTVRLVEPTSVTTQRARRLLQDRGHGVGEHVDRHGDERRIGAVERVAEVAVRAVDRAARPRPRRRAGRTRAPSRRGGQRAARPTDPPMSPTPTTATIKRRRRRPCPRPRPPPARGPRRRRSPRCAAPAARRRWRSRDRGGPRR